MQVIVVHPPGSGKQPAPDPRSPTTTDGEVDVLLLSAGYGAGHDQAAFAVGEALTELWPGCRTRQVDYLDLLDPTFRRLTQELYLTSLRHLPAGWGAFYQATSRLAPHAAWQRRLNRLGLPGLRQLLRVTAPKAIVCTYPLQSGVLSDLRRHGEPVPPQVTVITDHAIHNQWVHPYVDAYCVADAEVARGLEARGIKPERVHVTGLPVRAAFRRPTDGRALRARLGLTANACHVLLMGGALGMPGGVATACRTLLSLPLDLHLTVVCGRNRALEAELSPQAATWSGRLHVLGFVHEVAELMAAADLLVGKAGGITTAEALAVGLPVVIYRPIPGQEAANTAYLCRQGAAIAVSGARALGLAVRRLVEKPAQRQALAAAARALARPDAALDVARTVTSLCA